MRHATLLLPAVCAAILLATPVHARWGEAYAQCVERYGAAKHETKDNAGAVKEASFHVDDIVLTITFVKGKADLLLYQRADRQPLKTETILTVLTIHETATARFQPLPFDAKEDEKAGIEEHQKNLVMSVKYQSWVRSDTALWATWNRDSNTLQIRLLPDLSPTTPAPAGGGRKPQL